MSPTTAGFQELADTYVNVQLRGDRREALQFVDRLIHEGHSVANVPESSQAPRAGVGTARSASELT